jgi:hypothetical protein
VHVVSGRQFDVTAPSNRLVVSTSWRAGSSAAPKDFGSISQHHDRPSASKSTGPALVDLIGSCAPRLTQFSVVDQNVYNYALWPYRPAVAAMRLFRRGYDIVDLTADTVDFDYGDCSGSTSRPSLAGEHYRSRLQQEPLAVFLHRLPETSTAAAEMGQNGARITAIHRGQNIEFFQAAILINDKLPPHFAFLDAWVSGDGLTGHVRDPHPNHTRTFLASENAYALDWVAGEKMHIDPKEFASRGDALGRSDHAGRV